jgi:hypothetical protein
MALAQASGFELSEVMDDLQSSDKTRQNHAFQSLLQATQEPVEWVYEVWDKLLHTLHDGDNRQRSIAAQVLCNLAKSDPKERVLKDLGALLAVTKDERFVTARHCLQSLWKVAVVGQAQRKAVVKGLVQRFKECKPEKNCTLIRYDILAVVKRVHDITGDTSLRSTAETLIAIEEDPKYRKKYATLWRAAAKIP